ncbi:hypothetical protein PHYBOEH_010863 [Phytophthora boehmeriae]|uniref:Bacteriophage T5 Orf172 DNA-binding domain-containing protein n=1 Tax=Phytophthora boehmeriae TaxID=109152 RepID=A0A8T1VNH3_9STRA|nr:hypothetical protein PHYBOEH_010863 [Phytophthora boehmeriae]
MTMHTTRASEIREYYVTLEKVFKTYLSYCNAFMKQQLVAKNKQLVAKDEELKQERSNASQYKQLAIKKKLYKLDEYVYIATSPNYAKQNIFKIGRTVDPKQRMTYYQTGRCDEDRFSYLYIMRCVDSVATEWQLLRLLDNFRYGEETGRERKELFHIHYDLLIQFVRKVEAVEADMTKCFNQALVDYYDTYDDLKAVPFDKLVIEDLPKYVGEKFGIKSTSYYTPGSEIYVNLMADM